MMTTESNDVFAERVSAVKLDSGNAFGSYVRNFVPIVLFNFKLDIPKTCPDLQLGHTRQYRLLYMSRPSLTTRKVCWMPYSCPIIGEETDPPHPKAAAVKRGACMHRLKDGGALCNARNPKWFAYPDEQPTCKKCLSLMTQLRWWER
jgi:hypothetical protein